ncbi:MAG: AraC family transcriptional regulator [Polyangiaceae bacterium]
MSLRKTTTLRPVAAAVTFALARGVAVERLEGSTGLRIADLADPDARIPDEVMGAVWLFLDASFPDEPISLQLARGAPFSFFGVLSHAASYASDLRSALDTLIRYRALLSAELVKGLEETQGEAHYWMHHPLDDQMPSATPPEVAVAITARFVREVLGIEGALLRVDFRHPRTKPLSAYTDFFGTEVFFKSPRNALIFRPEALDWPTQAGDRHRFDFLVEHLDFLRARLVDSEGKESLRRIKGAIAENARRGEFGAEALAARLGTSLRTLQRQAQDEGVSVRALLDEAREAHARRLLEDPRLSVEEVSFLLGYSAESAFRRAFKRWTSRSPSEARRR